MAETTPKWVRDVAREMEEIVEKCRNAFLGGNRAVRFPDSEWFVTVILKYCPEDKVGKQREDDDYEAFVRNQEK